MVKWNFAKLFLTFFLHSYSSTRPDIQCISHISSLQQSSFSESGKEACQKRLYILYVPLSNLDNFDNFDAGVTAEMYPLVGAVLLGTLEVTIC